MNKFSSQVVAAVMGGAACMAGVPQQSDEQPRSSEEITLRSVMTQSQFDAAGISTLTPTQQGALDIWLQEFVKELPRAPAPSTATSGVSAESTTVKWGRPDVIAVVLVEPSFGRFIPVGGETIGLAWEKDEVKPVAIVEPSLIGFSVLNDTGFGPHWTKPDVLPIAIVEAKGGGFASISLGDEAAVGQGSGAASPAIEAKIDGEFEGWDGETIVKLTNGQVWQQSEYYFRYRYAFMPSVLIFRSNGVWRMKVEGIEKAVGVTQLR